MIQKIPPKSLFIRISNINSIFDITTTTLIGILLLLSFCSLCFVFHLLIKSHKSPHLQCFNSLWTVRFVLISFAVFWALNELIRLPIYRRRYLNHYLFPNITTIDQIHICRIHSLLSLGFFQPALLVTILFLLHVSIKTKTPRRRWVCAYIFGLCFPLTCLQVLVSFASKFGLRFFPKVLRRNAFIVHDDRGNVTVFCTNSVLSVFIFGVFAVGYSFWFVFSCWKVMALVINKSLRIRIYSLFFVVLISLPVQVVFLVLSTLWQPHEPIFRYIVMVVFISTFSCAIAGEGILVIRPISDSLAVGGYRRRLNTYYNSSEGKSNTRTMRDFESV